VGRVARDAGLLTGVEAESLRYYASQSPVTDPGGRPDLLTDLPRDVAALQRAARGLVIHYRADDPLAHGIPEERLREIDSRYAEAMLERLTELDDAPLTEPREPTERLVGCCRDFTVLFLAMARSVGIPARGRVGFASYFMQGFNVDHEVAEVWDPDAERWFLVDAELADEHVDPNDETHIDPLDIPRDRFLVGGAAWQLCRTGDADPEAFVVHPELEIEETRSWPQLRHNLIQDLAAMNKAEMILWDSWGLLRQPLEDRDHELLDRVAELTASTDPDLAELRRVYDDPLIRVPEAVTSHDPLGGQPREVTLVRR
jgi:transglutaminase superfamily protein